MSAEGHNTEGHMSQDDTSTNSAPTKPEPSLPFNLMGHELEDGFTLVEASAGTGKTYSITWLVTRLILERALEVSELLVVTFTIAATEEMKSRIRAHLADCLARWPEVERVAALHAQGASGEGSSAPAELLTIYERLSEEGRALASRRLQRAVDRFEEAQISTIHGFCSQALKEHAAELDLDLGRVQTQALRDPLPREGARGSPAKGVCCLGARSARHGLGLLGCSATRLARLSAQHRGRSL